MKEYMCLRVPWIDLEKVLHKTAKNKWTVLYIVRCKTGAYEIIFERVKE
jgi:hypothetical protein